jgi:hypothetical protein
MSHRSLHRANWHWPRKRIGSHMLFIRDPDYTKKRSFVINDDSAALNKQQAELAASNRLLDVFLVDIYR